MPITTHHSKRYLLAACLLAAMLPSLSACGDASNNTSSPSDVTAFKQAEHTLADILRDHACRVSWDCPYALDDLMYLARPYPDEATCRRELTIFHDMLISNDVRASIAAGRQRFDAARANVCLQKLRTTLQTRGCIPPPEFGDPFRIGQVAECQSLRLTTGLVSDGGVCTMREDCAEGLDCEWLGSDSCHGTCAPIPPEPCGDDGQDTCAPNESCVYEGGHHICRVRQPVGAPCDRQSNPCVEEAACYVVAGQTEGVCKLPGTIMPGEYCSSTTGRWCEDGFTCVEDRCEAIPIPAVKGAGEACDGREAVCAGGLVCRDEYTAEGRTGACGPPRSAGEPCGDDFECAAGLRCAEVAEGSVCAPRTAVGEPCRRQEECATFACVFGECVVVADRPVCEVPASSM